MGKQFSNALAAALIAGTAALCATPSFAAEGNTLVYAESSEPASIDPAKVNVNHELTVTRNVYDHLTNFDLDEPSKILPALAMEWERDGTTWTFKLRDGVKFHDGQAFTAEDVKATIDRDLAIGQGQSYLIKSIEKVTVVDPLTVAIQTKQPDVYLAGNLSRIEIMSAKDIAEHAGGDDKGAAYFAEHANGTGPYKFVKWTRGSDITFERNKDWWGEFPENAFDRVIDKFVTDGATRARGLEGGAYDLAAFVPRDEAVRIGASNGFSVVKGHNLWAWPAIYLNMATEPTSNADFREALVKVFDYDAMNQFYGGDSVTPRGPIPSWVPNSPETEMAEISKDVEGAKAALAKSGIANPSMTCSIPNSIPEFGFAATVLQASAAQIGIKVNVVLQPFVEAISAIKSNKSNCFVLGNANLSPVDSTKFMAAHYVTDAYYNTEHYSDPEFDRLVSEIPTVTDADERREMLKKASEMIVDSHSIIWAARPDTVVPVPDHVGGFRIDPAEYINVRMWELYKK